ncbi:phospholipase [Longibacter salinarum]|uniref:Phospholipase n=1 Tax=Longibacter salinarum TaxID=1850348 RepID=A0A2A8CVH5_9BACT|nr:dienelactone hydrolase family protein [Longibacter salinarum]PEN12692.1 phospholipase [Longibacter salinarum]
MPDSPNPHADQPVYTTGTALEDASAAMILIHGRGATAQSILRLAGDVAPEGVACLAPQAFHRTWYPQSFLAPIEQNEPYLTSALNAVDSLVTAIEDGGIPRTRLVLLGFSQGACLACEYAARHPQRYGGVVGLSGGLIGPEDEPLSYEGNLDRTPVFLGCSDQDPHIPLERMQDTAEVMRDMGANVDKRIYPGMGHTTNDDELRAVRDLLVGLVSEPA